MSDYVAWYGAVLATLVAVFNIWVWARRRSRLRISIRGNVCYEDGEEGKRSVTPTGGEIVETIEYYHVEVINVGELPTTIISVEATTRIVGLFERCRRGRFKGQIGFMGFQPHNGWRLPHELSAGGVWSCRVRQDRIENLCQGGIPKLELRAACSSVPIYKNFPVDPTVVEAWERRRRRP